MTLFEYLSVALSIVLAFGATHILGNLRYVFESGRRYWVHAFIVILILILYPQNWWAFWDLSRSENWNSYTFLLSVLGPGILYMMVVTLGNPDSNGDDIGACGAALTQPRQHHSQSQPRDCGHHRMP